MLNWTVVVDAVVEAFDGVVVSSKIMSEKLLIQTAVVNRLNAPLFFK